MRIALVAWWAAVVAEFGLAPVVYGGRELSFGFGVGVAAAPVAGIACWSWARKALAEVIPRRPGAA